MKNYIQPGNVLPLTMPAAVKSGDGVLVGTLFGVAAIDGASGAVVDCALTGVYELPKATGAITQGQAIYWDNTAKKVTGTASSNRLIGAAIEAAVSGAATLRVRLAGAAV